MLTDGNCTYREDHFTMYKNIKPKLVSCCMSVILHKIKNKRDDKETSTSRN